MSTRITRATAIAVISSASILAGCAVVPTGPSVEPAPRVLFDFGAGFDVSALPENGVALSLTPDGALFEPPQVEQVRRVEPNGIRPIPHH